MISGTQQHITITGSEDFFNFYTHGFTINAWVRLNSLSDFSAIASKFESAASDDISVPDETCWKALIYDENYNEVDISIANSISLDQWYMVTMVFDNWNNVIKLYINGLLADVSKVQDNTKIAPCQSPFIIGSDGTDNPAYWDGLLDEISIWSYAVDKYEIARIYANLTGTIVKCVEIPDADLTGDCKVDLNDFVKMASQWMQNGNAQSWK